MYQAFAIEPYHYAVKDQLRNGKHESANSGVVFQVIGTGDHCANGRYMIEGSEARSAFERYRFQNTG
jgi:hypothetical protein